MLDTPLVIKKAPILGRWKNTILSVFIVLNLATVVFMNLPSLFCDKFNQAIEASLAPTAAYNLRLVSWRWQQYAYFTGLDNKWQMFGYQSRFNWWYDIRAVYSDGVSEKTVLLPLPNQDARTISEKLLFDFKERKFELNIYLNEAARESYSRYIARQYPVLDDLPIQSIRWHLAYQNILPPDEAVAAKRLHDPHCYVQLLNEFAVGKNHDSNSVKLPTSEEPKGRIAVTVNQENLR